MLRKLLAWGKPARPTLLLEDRPVATTPSTEAAANQELDVTDGDFAEHVLQHAGVVVVDFWAEWCQPCTIMSAYVGFLARDFAGQLRVAALDVDENPETPAHYQVMGLPTLLFFRQGMEIERVVGVVTYAELQAKVRALLAPPT